jgi:ribonuclease BN (tRNA processing enzyme)
LVYDTQYTEKEYNDSKIGWGHTPIEYAIKASKRAEVKKVALFHHEPMRTDEQMDELASIHCTSGGTGGTAPEVFFAREGMEVKV